MSSREQLWYLINGLLDGSYCISVFCDEFTRIYNIDCDFSTMTEAEKIGFADIERIACRFSDFEEDLKIPNVFCTEAQVRAKVEEVKKRLNK